MQIKHVLLLQCSVCSHYWGTDFTGTGTDDARGPDQQLLEATCRCHDGFMKT